MPILTKKLLLFLQQDPEPNEMAKYLTLIEVVKPSPKAATISAINDDGSIYEIARFGLAGKDPFLDINPIWEKLQPFDEVRAGRVSLIEPQQVVSQIVEKGNEVMMDPWLKSVLVVPVLKKDVPIGAIGLFFDEELSEVPKLEIDYESLQALFVLAFRTPQFAYAIAKYSVGELPELTDQELLLINLIARGYSNKQIGIKTQLALPTVKAKVSKLLKDFGAKNRKHLVEIAKEKNIPSPRL